MPIAANIRQPYVSREALAQGFEGLLHDYDIYNYTGATYGMTPAVWPSLATFKNGSAIDLDLALTTTTEHVISCTLRFNFSTGIANNLIYIYPRSNGVQAGPLTIFQQEGSATTSGARNFFIQTSLWNAGAGASAIDFAVASSLGGTLWVSQVSAHCHSLRIA